MNSFQKVNQNLLNFVSEPPLPWQSRIVIPGAGIIASGWTNDNNVFLLSANGYSISNPLNGQVGIRNYDEENTAMAKFSKDNLEFTIEEVGQTVKVFGLRGGNGNHLTTDFWNLESFNPSLHQQLIGLRNLKVTNNETEYWKQFTLISLSRLEYSSLRYGFSPNENHYGIFSSAGAEVFTRV